MDLWVIAAAAGAGYVAKNLQNLSLDTKETLIGSSSSSSSKYSYNFRSESRNLLQQLRDRTCPLRRLEQTVAAARDDVDDHDQMTTDVRDTEFRVASEKNRFVEDYNSIGWISSSPPMLFERLEVEDGKIRNLGSNFTRPGKLSSSCFESAKPPSFRYQGSDAMLLFVTGMTVGIMSATTAWKNEVEKSNKQLNQMHNLVQDLHEELDMKDVLIVKEITDEEYLPPQENDTPPSIHEPITSPSNVADEEDRKTENLSKIEAELEAELEMLENNLKIYGVSEIDPVFEPDIVRVQPVNYAVNPWELSLRLHELIESRLEKRINELETALAKTQNGDKVLGSQTVVFPKRIFSYSETESSSTHQSPACICYIDKDQENEEGDGAQFFDKQISTRFMSNEDCSSEDEGTDESEMLLIKQIVERTKSGSSFNLKI
ncbi:hypothetical protein ABFS82_12G091900 [Erythranthe guttata]|uniref:uncharacterized protein LOC105967576 n=1 Tax=Erythranthe guttata TaxID=4155 RepID=UPI00064D9000|nr:PREDICTED: uncharacterized protein LOC105967576 [Erythranthe guttata]|eukprot:XP_012847634.1 PREDICTED: uncharacterized protein LOC105967576 [Erythranthe guttata]